jgi:hypothetical protein
MAIRFKSMWFAATALAMLAGAGLSCAQAQDKPVVVDPNKFSAGSKAAEVNSANQPSRVPDVSGATKTVTGEGNGHDNAGMVIPGIGKATGGAAGLDTPGSVPQERSKDVPGFDVSNTGANGLNLPGSTPSSHVDDASKLTGKMNQDAKGIVDQAGKGGVNGLNVPTSASADVTSSDDTGSKSGNKSGSNGGQTGKSGSGGGTGSSTPVMSTSKGTINNLGGTNTVTNSDGSKTTTTIVTDKDKSYMTTFTQNVDGSTKTTYQEYDRKTGKLGPVQTSETLPTKPTKKSGTPSDDGSSSGREVGGLSARSAVAKKNQGGGTDNNSESSSGRTGGLSPNSSYANRLHGDGAGDAGDNNNPYKSGGLAARTSLAKKDQGDGGDSDSRGGGGATSRITGKLKKVGGGGTGELAATPSSHVIGGGLLEGDSGFSQQGPATAGAASRPATAITGATGVVVKSRSY